MPAFAQELKKWRKRLDITQAQAADLLDVSAAAIADWEQERYAPHYEAMVRKRMQNVEHDQKAKTQ